MGEELLAQLFGLIRLAGTVQVAHERYNHLRLPRLYFISLPQSPDSPIPIVGGCGKIGVHAQTLIRFRVSFQDPLNYQPRVLQGVTIHLRIVDVRA